MPAVTVELSPSGEPKATTGSPTCSACEAPERGGLEVLGRPRRRARRGRRPGCGRRRWRRSGCRPGRRPRSGRRPRRRRATTWLLVMTWPCRSSTKPGAGRAAVLAVVLGDDLHGARQQLLRHGGDRAVVGLAAAPRTVASTSGQAAGATVPSPARRRGPVVDARRRPAPPARPTTSASARRPARPSRGTRPRSAAPAAPRHGGIGWVPGGGYGGRRSGGAGDVPAAAARRRGAAPSGGGGCGGRRTQEASPARARAARLALGAAGPAAARSSLRSRGRRSGRVAHGPISPTTGKRGLSGRGGWRVGSTLGERRGPVTAPGCGTSVAGRRRSIVGASAGAAPSASTPITAAPAAPPPMATRPPGGGAARCSAPGRRRPGGSPACGAEQRRP